MPQDSDAHSQTRISRLAAYAPVLRGPLDHWIEITPLRGSGTASDPYVMGSGVPRLTKAALEFVEMLYDAGWVLKGFDWVQWSKSEEGVAMFGNRNNLNRATEDQIARTLTTIVRQDRFVEGTFSDAVRSGIILALAERAERLRPSVP